MADAGYTTYSTMIEGMADYVAANPDLTKRFVEASIIGWYNYLYGDNKAANDWIKKDNPDMTDEQIAFTISQMKNTACWSPGEAEAGGIGCFSDAGVKAFYDKMVDAGVVKAGLDLVEGLHDGIRLQGRRQGACEVSFAARRRAGGRDRRRSAPVLQRRDLEGLTPRADAGCPNSRTRRALRGRPRQGRGR